MLSALAELAPGYEPMARYFAQRIQAAGGTVIITSVRRSAATQQRLYDAAQSGRSPYPAAKPGHSLHERGLAFDMVVTPREWQAAAGAFWERLGGRWGGRFHDPVHFDWGLR